MRSVREPAGRSRETFWRPVLPSGKAKVRLLVWIVGAGPCDIFGGGLVSGLGFDCSIFFSFFKRFLGKKRDCGGWAHGSKKITVVLSRLLWKGDICIDVVCCFYHDALMKG